MKSLSMNEHIRKLHAGGEQRFAFRQSVRLFGRAFRSVRRIGEREMMGRSLTRLIASTTRWLNAPPWVLTPIGDGGVVHDRYEASGIGH